MEKRKLASYLFCCQKGPENERTTDSPGLLKVIPASDRKLHDELYELVGFVVEINNSAIGHDGGPLDRPSIGGSAYIGQGGESHLISFVNIPISDAYGANDEVDVVTKTVQNLSVGIYSMISWSSQFLLLKPSTSHILGNVQ